MRETLKWLDEATSKFPHAVTLQGAEDFYQSWAEVEKFVVPRTLFSENDGLDELEPEPEMDGIPDDDMSKLTLADITRKTPASSAASNGSRSLSPSSMRSQRSSVSAMSPPTSPVKATPSPEKPAAPVLNTKSSTSVSVPLRLQPLFNYILWRIHQEVDPVSALESFIFLCNDQTKVNYAKGFEIRSKCLEQLREAISREDRDFKNRQMVLQREIQSAAASSALTGQSIANENTQVVQRSPPVAPAAMLPKQQQPQVNVIDPDTFGRPPTANVQQSQPNYQQRSPRPHNATTHASRGGQNLPFAPRGNIRGNFRGPRGRGNLGTLARGGFAPYSRVDNTVPNSQIDPNSFIRPRGSGYTGRGGRKLWVPT